MAKKKKVEEEDEEDEVFHVEVITKARVNDDQEWEYYVKWGGYDSDANSWEPGGNVKECKRLLESFWNHIGYDDKDYPVGFEVAAKDNWIQKEKKFFAAHFAEEQLKRDESEEERKRKKSKQKKEKSKQSNKAKKKRSKSGSDQSYSDPSSESDVPLSKSVRSVSQKRKKPVVTDSDSGPEGPPLKQLRAGSSASASTSIASLSKSKGKQKALPPRPSSPDSLFQFPSSPPRIMPDPSSPPRVTPVPPRPSTSTSVPVKPPPASVRTHQDQQSKPLVKQIDLTSKTVASGSALSTKQRIAAGVTAPPTNPKPKPKPPMLLTKPSALAGLKMKKNKPSAGTPTDPKSGENHTPTSATAPLSSSITGSFSAFKVTDTPAADHPTPQFTFQDEDAQPNLFGSDDPPIPWRASPEPMAPPPPPRPVVTPPPLTMRAAPPPPKTSAQLAADDFLKSMELPGLNTPLEVSGMMEDVIEPMPPKSWAPQKAPTARIPKKFKWSGELFTDTASGLAERLCEVAMKDPSDPKDGVRISLLVSPLDSLRIHKLYTIPQLNAVFRACDGAKQFAKMGPASEKDSEAVTLFTRHMLTKRQVAVIPLSLDGSEVALLFIFPAKSDGLCNYLRVPQQMRSNEPLIAALLPWKVLSSKFAQHPAQRPLDKTLHQNSQSVAHINRQSTGRPIKKRSLAQAMKLLGFPKALLDFMAIGVRPYCVWFPSDGDAKQPGFETRLLRFILGKTQATFVSPESTVRVIFIHVGALNTLDQFPMLASRRRDSPEIQFWTYGTHHSVSCDRWGVREIYPLGGVITFTPSAILENPVDSYQIMDRASEHPLWECYLLPEVLGLVTSDVTTNNTGEISGFQGGQHDYLMPIIDLIDTRGVSVLWAPFDVDTRLSSSQWLRWQINTMGLAGEQLAEECVKAASSRYSNIPQSQLSTTVETDISQDLRRMQTQPSLVDECRRFVVIKAPSEDHIAWDRDELEWCSATKFDFMDDFFT